LLQKFTFLSYLTWICLLNLALYKKIHFYQFEEFEEEEPQ
jgi:hypothetical protein